MTTQNLFYFYFYSHRGTFQRSFELTLAINHLHPFIILVMLEQDFTNQTIYCL